MIEESFEEAKQNFSKFLLEQNLPKEIVWLFREDVIWQENRVLITGKLSISENEKIAKNLYELGKLKDFGVDLHAFCIWESKIGCTILLPEDELDAGYKLMSSEYLKMSCSTDPVKSVIIKNSMSWKLFKFLSFTEPLYIKEKKDLLPFKKNLQFP